MALEAISVYVRALSNIRHQLNNTPEENASAHPNTHFKFTLRRSALFLGDKIKGTLKALGIHRRFQIVYFPHLPEVAGESERVVGGGECP